MGIVYERDDEGNRGISTIIFCVGKDSKIRRSKCTLYQDRISASRRGGHDPTIGSPISPATSASSPEKTIAQSLKCSGWHSCTIVSRTMEGIRLVCFQLTALGYAFPADRGDAPRAWMVNHGWFARRVMKRWPTVPVAPSTPTLTFFSSSTLCKLDMVNVLVLCWLSRAGRWVLVRWLTWLTRASSAASESARR